MIKKFLYKRNFIILINFLWQTILRILKEILVNFEYTFDKILGENVKTFNENSEKFF